MKRLFILFTLLFFTVNVANAAIKVSPSYLELDANQSKKDYSSKYNKSHKSIRIENEIYEKLKLYLENKNISIKDYVENLIKNSLD